MGEPAGFREFVDALSAELLRTAYLLTGDWHLAEDLVQTALAKALPRWPRIVRRDAPEVYVRRILVTTFLSWRTRRWNGEVPTERLPDSNSPDVEAASDARITLLAAIRTLPRRQRAVIALRFFDDLTEARTAEVLGCSVGTVKSQTARALVHLRKVPALEGLFTEEVV